MDKPLEFQKVIEAANIREVVLTSTNCKCHIHYSLVEPKHTLLNIKQKKVNTDLITIPNKKGGIIFSTVDFKIEGISQKDIKTSDKTILNKKGEPLFTISASYIVTYDISETNLNKDAIRYFGIENAYFNVYPYLREFITHITQRFNLRPLVIPLLKPNKQPKKSGKKPIEKSKTKQVKSNKKQVKSKKTHSK